MFKQGSLHSPIQENRYPSSCVREGINAVGENAYCTGDRQLLNKEVFHYTYLNLEDLKCFEVVERQYAQIGVIFDNCIAIHPSNPAFPANSGKIVLLGAPGGGFMEARFLQPVRAVKAFVTSSQRLVMSAYSRDRQLIAQTILPGANLANSNSLVPPNALVAVTGEDIHCVSFGVFNGQFTIDDFSFCLAASVLD